MAPARPSSALQRRLDDFAALQSSSRRSTTPVVGLSAALVGWADFIYCTPRTYLLTPFSSLGPARANEALLMSRRLGAEELRACGFVNDILAEDGPGFRERVLREVDEWLGAHLRGESILAIKELLRRPDRPLDDAQGVHEIVAGLRCFASGIPQEEFRRLASGEKRHKL
ncbi:hypothetical protein E4U42_002659 [Claviceps africana]|uniref:Uncharacterized protein n=1 Tax=Claviceps africana TaxID=83212 RepID=A0A8K0J7N9_9HYPO|nr:hypothetical protein E4U42_002659 [Claviceps africana]